MAHRSSENIKGARVLVVGLGVTGQACARALPKYGAEAVVTDVRTDISRLEGAIAAVEAAGARFAPYEAALGETPDILVLSPGLAPGDARVSPLRNNAGEWMSEIELAYRISKGKILAVTGTNAKTTVTTLAGLMAAAEFNDTRVAGNIGDAFIDSAAGSGDETVFIVEVSSYQLEGCSSFRPDVAIELNVQADHLKRHHDMEEYAAVKARMLANMGPGDSAVLNADDARVAAMKNNTKARIVMFSADKELSEGACVSCGKLVLRRGGEETALASVESLKMRGRHNVGNALAAAAGAYMIGVPVEKIYETAAGFKGLPHRIETVGWVNGIECVNDSKATNPDSTIVALETFKGREVTLIIGGDDKGFDLSPVYEAAKAASAKVIVMGPGLARAAEEIKRYEGIESLRAANMKEAVRIGLETTAEGGVLLLSPASSSFDLYRNYEERGSDFRDEIGRTK
ncbi:MAG: UDP-N-acetylmuramoyl-L-alanine--D-glutamate ligase [bacterium]